MYVGRSDCHIRRQQSFLRDCATTLFCLGHSELLPLEASSRHAMLVLYIVCRSTAENCIETTYMAHRLLLQRLQLSTVRFVPCRFTIVNSRQLSTTRFAPADKKPSVPDQQPLPHVTEEAEAYDKILGKVAKSSPGPEEEGVTVKELFQQDDSDAPAAIEQEVHSEAHDSETPPPASSGLARQEGQVLDNVTEETKFVKDATENDPSSRDTQSQLVTSSPSSIMNPKRQFDPLPLRVDDVLGHLVNIIMKDGRKATAQRIVQDALEFIRLTSSNSTESPVTQLKRAILVASPIMKMKSQKSGKQKVVEVPISLHGKQSRRRGIKFILDASGKRSNQKFGIRLGEEVVAVLNGTSAALERKRQVHRLGIQYRANTR